MSKGANYWILGYPRDVDYKREAKRRRYKKNGIGLNTMYKCNSCGKVWEEHVMYQKKQFITYTDIPSYGLNRHKCKICIGEENG